MPVNQPPIKERSEESSWDLEVTRLINELEQQIAALLRRIEELERTR